MRKSAARCKLTCETQTLFAEPLNVSTPATADRVVSNHLRAAPAPTRCRLRPVFAGRWLFRSRAERVGHAMARAPRLYVARLSGNLFEAMVDGSPNGGRRERRYSNQSLSQSREAKRVRKLPQLPKGCV